MDSINSEYGDLDGQDENYDPDSNFLCNVIKDSNYFTDEKLCNTLKNKNGLSIVHFNARSLNANFRNIEMYFSELDFKFDIIAVTETWFHENTHTSVFNIMGYDMYHVPRSGAKGGGVALYINSSLKCKKIESKSVCVEDIFECITVDVSLDGTKNVIVACVYRKPGFLIENFTVGLEDLFCNVKNKVIYITGDFNIDLLKSDTHSPTKQFIDTMYSLGLYPLITRPSRITSHSATLIDNIFTNELRHENISGLVLNDITDHLPVFTLYDYRVRRQNDNLGVCHRKMDDQAIQRLFSELETHDWEPVYSKNNVNMSYEVFVKQFGTIVDKNCPKSVKYMKNGTETKPWLSKCLINACRKKNMLYVNFLKSKLQVDELKYKTYKNKLTKILRAAERAYYNEQLNKQKNNMKTTWKILNEVIKGTAVSSKIPDVFLEHDKEIHNRKEIANAFNNFFVGVGPNLAKGIHKPANVCIKDFLPEANIDTMFLEPVSEEEIINTVKACGNKTSLDCHDMNMSLIKKIIVPIAKPLEYIFNLSLSSGIFPDLMKVAKVVPLFKSGQNNVFTNYRPVSLLPQFSKILEKLFNKRLDKFLSKCNILSENQYGFREKRSTAMALMQLVEDITQSIDNRQHTIGVFIDLKKAFDTIDHNILLDKLYHYGLRGNAHFWIKSYLENRKQYVQLENLASDYMNVVCGVPQGSILGPKLFILYINDMCRVSECLKFILFADDTNLFCSGNDLLKLSETVTHELSKLKNWFAVNMLSLNVSKTNYMLFSNSRCDRDISIHIANVEISRVNVTKFLGVLIDDKLTWNEHISLVKSKVSRSIFLLNRAKHVFNYRAMLTLYNSIVLPYLSYCCELWGNTYKTRLTDLVVLQKRAVRIIHGAQYRAHTNILFCKSKTLKFFDLVKLNVAIIMYKAYHYMLPKKLQVLFSRNIYTDERVETRQKLTFKQPWSRTSQKNMCVSVRGVQFWNSLEQTLIDNNKTLHKFKKCIKAMCLQQYDVT